MVSTAKPEGLSEDQFPRCPARQSFVCLHVDVHCVCGSMCTSVQKLDDDYSCLFAQAPPTFNGCMSTCSCIGIMTHCKTCLLRIIELNGLLRPTSDSLGFIDQKISVEF